MDKIWKYTCSLIVLMLMAGSLSAQYTSRDKKAVKIFEEGRIHYSRMEMTEAAEFFKLALERDPAFIEPALALGDIYYRSKQYELCIEYFGKALEIDPYFKPMLYMRLADAERKLSRFDAAKAHLETFASLGNMPPEIRASFDPMYRSVKFAAKAVKNPVPFDPKNMGPSINTAEEDYHPSLTVDKRLFVFSRKTPIRANDGRVRYQEDLYYSTGDGTGKWNPAKNFRGPINTTQANEGASSISHDGKYLFFTICPPMEHCNIHISWLGAKGWERPVKMPPPVNSSAWDAHPSFSPDGKTLYFSSARKGGRGKSDIWMIRQNDDGSWGEPKSLPFNTSGSEMTPFMHADGTTLYFSSDGLPGMGEHDLFVVKMDSRGNWGTPRNLGYPINSIENEYSMIADPDGRLAYFASERDGGYGKLDIYQFLLPDYARPITSSYLSGVVFDSETNEKLDADVELIDLATEKVMIRTQSDKTYGTFLASLPSERNYALNVSRKGYLFYSENFALKKQTKAAPRKLVVPLIPIKKGARVVLRNVFFETGKYDLQPESRAELNKLVKYLGQNPDLRIEIGGHTDNQGTAATNKTLSANRAKAVFQYLVDQGVDSSRLASKGYGQDEPIADNGTEEGRAQNRRTEFTIL
ncbi:PD40 domain-containing protein [bacterium SCSIO 12741]|nr:PD40 domain-containing protein [bacterium SCSIO 12741]